MADALMSTRTQEILARDLGLFPSDYGVYTVKSGLTTLKPGMIVTTFGETGSDIDIYADGDEYATGVVQKRSTRRISAGGDISDDVDDTFAAGDEVIVIHWTGGRAHAYVWLTGLDATTNDEGTGLARRGAPVYLPTDDPTALSLTNATVGALMAFGAALAVTIIGVTRPLWQVGVLLEDATIVDSASAVQGILAKVAI